jgi:hypothetical protein
MKKRMVTLIVLFVVGSNSAYANSDDFSLSAGVLSWYNWHVPVMRIDGMDTPHNSSALMVGPTIKAQYKDLYCGVTYLISTHDYQLANTSVPIGVYQTNATSSASRQDIDVVIGYMLTPRLSLQAGYKGIFFDDDLTLVANGTSYNAKHNEMFNMGAVGAGVNIPIGTNVIWVLNGNALLGTFHNDISYPAGLGYLNDFNKNYTAWGLSADTSVTYTFFNNLSANIGLKFQYIKAVSDESNSLGPTFGLNYQF